MRIAETSTTLAQVLNRLSKHRKVFHSEADFQFALAWEIQKSMPEAQVRMESRLPRQPGAESSRGAEYIDIEIRLGLARTALELKYITKRWSGPYASEDFALKNHSALDQRRYDIVKDVTRVERFVAADSANRNGAVVVLTNDLGLSSVPKRPWNSTIDAEFRLHEGVVLSGPRIWGSAASEGTTRGRTSALEIGGEYRVAWNRYADEPIALNTLVIAVGCA